MATNLNTARLGNPSPGAVRAGVTGSLSSSLGQMGGMSVNGYLTLATNATNGNCLGVFTYAPDNSSGVAGAKEWEVEPGIFKMYLSGGATAGALVSNADLGKQTYVLNPYTVTLNTGSASVKAGALVRFETDTVTPVAGAFAYINFGVVATR